MIHAGLTFAQPSSISPIRTVAAFTTSTIPNISVTKDCSLQILLQKRPSWKIYSMVSPVISELHILQSNLIYRILLYIQKKSSSHLDRRIFFIIILKVRLFQRMQYEKAYCSERKRDMGHRLLQVSASC